jgi:glutathione S-transferase
MPALTLFHDPTSEPSRAVHWFALEAGIELELKYTWLTRGEHRSPEFLHINPAHQVPALRHGEFCLPEASAIMLYLAELAGCTDKWVGHSARERACTNRFTSWHHTNTRKTVTLDYALPVLLMPAYKGDPPPGSEETEQLKKNILRSLALFEKLLAGWGQFLGSERPSVADLFIASDVFVLDADPASDELIRPFPVVVHWLDVLRKRAAYVASHKQWNAVAPQIRALLLKRTKTPGTRPGWRISARLLPCVNTRSRV